VIYTIGPVDKLRERYRRSLSLPVTSSLRTKRAVQDPSISKKQENGTNMQVLKLNTSAFETVKNLGSETSGSIGHPVLVPAVGGAISLLLLLACCCCCCCVCCRRKRRHAHRKERNTSDKEAMRENNANMYTGRNLYAEKVVNTPSKTGTLTYESKTSTLKGKDANIRIHRNEWTRPKSGTEV